MTPAILLARKAKIPHTIHEYQHDAEAESYGGEAAEKLGQSPERVFKTLVVQLDAALAVAILPVNRMLSLKQMAKAAGSKKAAMADKVLAQRSTGYVLGGVSPLGQKKRLLTVLDDSSKQFSTIFVSAGRRGLEIELAAADLQALTQARLASISAED
ncbi:Cys-tRNA(Pro) deacylase [Allohahella marinimesophila]|uniref:Cys-tRNA(Pro)/Cys-tRNA(Cys) deacylase n=1 Tax=Allohahella marinimesophila TaxID=1054972 RepID=A0ABP7PPN1_9GAMM